ncbi:hypothetical protein CQA53_10000 [Helicobacter didelphidarum]|uniref:ATRX ADD domain-containing protein n=1 Tax=Helicobacter didelphidarum TaxID=2040648 RepID=A0A3D8I992_9HELI|nr:hypothetical protein [Helicobacter didelphidarum]RDU61536.1 hypothetical protein CQA53_10000 [Helicobacter didelphidarum]
MLLYKTCEVCGNRINKLQSIWNIYDLKMGDVLQCPNCSTAYQTNKIIMFLGRLNETFMISWIMWLVIAVCINIFWNYIFHNNANMFIAFLLSFLLIVCINFIIMCFIPLYQTQILPCNKTQKSYIIWLKYFIFAVIIISSIFGIFGIFG